MSALLNATDRIAVALYRCLVSDFRVLLDDPKFGARYLEHLDAGPAEYRRLEPTECGDVEPYRFKCYHQLSNIFKKYTFTNDLYSNAERQEQSITGFLEFQQRSLPELTGWLVTPVLGRARKICREILGKYDEEEVCVNVKIGSRATVGGPRKTAYPHLKFGEARSFTSTTFCSKWFFRDYLPNDQLLSEVVNSIRRKKAFRLEHDALPLVLVPKTWKVDRVITPLTLIGLFYTYGVGRVIQNRLKAAGLDITKLQDRHRRSVQEYSKTRSHATADLSRASDSIYLNLLRRLLPPEWYYAVKRGICRQVYTKDATYMVNSVLPMGNGFTFPLETLVFYCVVRAVKELLGKPGTVSVYGDDLIYPTSIHDAVAYILPRLGFNLNLKKTYAKISFFRESCGGDYYRGLDVRPFILPAESWKDSQRLRVSCFLYKCVNGLLRRWREEEIPRTIAYLLSEIQIMGDGRVLQVPMSYPEESGMRVERPHVCSPFAPVHKSLHFDDGEYAGCVVHAFDCLVRQAAERRPVRSSETIYYWLALSGSQSSEDAVDWERNVVDLRTPTQKRIDHSIRVLDSAGMILEPMEVPVLPIRREEHVTWRKGKRVRVMVKVKEWVGASASKEPPSLRRGRVQVTDWY